MDWFFKNNFAVPGVERDIDFLSNVDDLLRYEIACEKNTVRFEVLSRCFESLYFRENLFKGERFQVRVLQVLSPNEELFELQF